MELKSAINITVAYRNACKDERLKYAINFVLHKQCSRALNIFFENFQKDKNEFYFIQLVINNLERERQGIELINDIPSILRQPYSRCLEQNFKPTTAFEKYVTCLAGTYEWHTGIEERVLNYYMKLHKYLKKT